MADPTQSKPQKIAPTWVKKFWHGPITSQNERLVKSLEAISLLHYHTLLTYISLLHYHTLLTYNVT